MIGANETAPELRALIAGEFPPIASAREIDDLKSLLSMMGQDASVLNDLHSWVDLVSVIGQSPDLDSKLAFLEGASWRAFLPAWMTVCLDLRIPKARHNGLAAIAVGSIQRPPASDPARREIFEMRVSGLTEGQRRAIRRWAVWMTSLPLFADDPQLPARIEETWGAAVART